MLNVPSKTEQAAASKMKEIEGDKKKNAVGYRDRDKSVEGSKWECSAQLPVAVIDLKVNMVAGSEFWQKQPTVEKGACPLALHVASHCALV